MSSIIIMNTFAGQEQIDAPRNQKKEKSSERQMCINNISLNQSTHQNKN